MSRVLSIAAFLVSPVCLAQSPASELAAAHADALKLVGEEAHFTRYLTIYSIPEAKRKEYARLLDYWPNGLSREPDIVKPRKVTDTLYAVRLDDYGWRAEVWEKLLDAPEPWFHVRVKIPANVKPAREHKVYWRGGGSHPANWYFQEAARDQVVTVPAPWVDLAQAHELSLRLNTAVPIVRADWFVFQTGQEGGKAGYYQWLSLKNGKDVDDLAGVNRTASRSILLELAAIVADSGVGLNSRLIVRFAGIGGSLIETRDTSDPRKNPLRELDRDFKPDAFEIYLTLPNGLFGFALLNNKGELQATAPDTIASDSKSTNRDARVRVGVSCIRCHVEGLRPIDDWARKVFTRENELGLGSPDRDVYRRLKQLYLGPLERSLKEDVGRYSAALNDACGLKPGELAKLFSASWHDYESRPILTADIAREVGIPEKEFAERLKKYVQVTGTVDTVLAGIKAGVPTRREHLEEALPLLMPIIGNGK